MFDFFIRCNWDTIWQGLQEMSATGKSNSKFKESNANPLRSFDQGVEEFGLKFNYKWISFSTAGPIYCPIIIKFDIFTTHSVA